MQLLQCQNLLLKIEFRQISLYYISGQNQDIEELFSGLTVRATDLRIFFP